MQLPSGAASKAEGKKSNAIQLHCLVLASDASQYICHCHASAAGVYKLVLACFKSQEHCAFTLSKQAAAEVRPELLRLMNTFFMTAANDRYSMDLAVDCQLQNDQVSCSGRLSCHNR